MTRLISEKTKVPVRVTQTHIQTVMANYDCSDAHFVSEVGREIICFTRSSNKAVYWVVPVPIGSGSRIEQDIKARWRSALYGIESNLDQIARGIQLWELAFHAHIKNPRTGLTPTEENFERLQLPAPPPSNADPRRPRVSF